MQTAPFFSSFFWKEVYESDGVSSRTKARARAASSRLKAMVKANSNVEPPVKTTGSNSSFVNLQRMFDCSADIERANDVSA